MDVDTLQSRVENVYPHISFEALSEFNLMSERITGKPDITAIGNQQPCSVVNVGAVYYSSNE